MATAQKEKEFKWAEPPEYYYHDLFRGEEEQRRIDFQRLVGNYQILRELGETHREAIRNSLSDFESKYRREVDDRTRTEFDIFVRVLNESKTLNGIKTPDYEKARGMVIASRAVSMEPAKKDESLTEAFERHRSFYAQVERVYDEMMVAEQYNEELKKLAKEEERKKMMESVPHKRGLEPKVKEESIVVSKLDVKIGNMNIRVSVSGKNRQEVEEFIKNNPPGREVNRDDLARIIKDSDFVVLKSTRLVVDKARNETYSKETFDAMKKKDVAELVQNREVAIEVEGQTSERISTKEYKEEKRKYSLE